MVNNTEIAHDIILKLAKETEKETDLSDPYIQKLILELNSVAKFSVPENNINQGYYSVKDVAELFDVNKQTVYKWIKEEKIQYKIDGSPGKVERKGYRIPKEQFQTEKDMQAVDPTFKGRREKDMEDIPNTGLGQKDIYLPGTSNEDISYEEIQRRINRNYK